MTFTLDQIQSRPSRDVTMLLECAGNRGFATFMGAVHNATWTGTPLAPLLREAGVQDGGIEVVFFGADTGTETIREMSSVGQDDIRCGVFEGLARDVSAFDTHGIGTGTSPHENVLGPVSHHTSSASRSLQSERTCPRSPTASSPRRRAGAT